MGMKYKKGDYVIFKAGDWKDHNLVWDNARGTVLEVHEAFDAWYHGYYKIRWEYDAIKLSVDDDFPENRANHLHYDKEKYRKLKLNTILK